MNASNHNIEIVCEPHHVSEAVQAILHSIVFFRSHGKFSYKHEGSYSIGTLGYEEVCCNYLELTYVRCSSPSLVASVDAKIKEFVDRLLPNYYSDNGGQPNAEQPAAPSYPSVSHVHDTSSLPSPGSLGSAGIPSLLTQQRLTNNYKSCCGTIYLEFYSRRPSRWPFNEANITWEVWAIKVSINPVKTTQHMNNYAQLGAADGMIVGDSNGSSLGNIHTRTEQLVSQKLIEISQVINSDKYYLPQMPSQQHVSTVFDTSHIDSQPYLFKISFKIGENQHASSSSVLKKFIRETMAL